MRLVENFEIEIGHYGADGRMTWIGVCPIIEHYDPEFGYEVRSYMEEYDALDGGYAIPNYPIPPEWEEGVEDRYYLGE